MKHRGTPVKTFQHIFHANATGVKAGASSAGRHPLPRGNLQHQFQVVTPIERWKPRGLVSARLGIRYLLSFFLE